MKDLREKAINNILKHEGGYSNDPSDSGSETMWGITIKEARRSGYNGPMKELPKELAIKIYEKKYLDKIKFDKIAEIKPSLAIKLSDMSVNIGVDRASKILQRALNAFNNNGKEYDSLAEDGIIGDFTISALREFYDKRGVLGIEVLQKAVKGLLVAYYIELGEKYPKNKKFMYGWIRRV